MLLQLGITTKNQRTCQCGSLLIATSLVISSRLNKIYIIAAVIAFLFIIILLLLCSSFGRGSHPHFSQGNLPMLSRRRRLQHSSVVANVNVLENCIVNYTRRVSLPLNTETLFFLQQFLQWRNHPFHPLVHNQKWIAETDWETVDYGLCTCRSCVKYSEEEINTEEECFSLLDSEEFLVASIISGSGSKWTSS